MGLFGTGLVPEGFQGSLSVIAKDGSIATLGLDQNIEAGTLTDLPDLEPRGEVR